MFFLMAGGGPYKRDSEKLQTFRSQSRGWKPRAAKVLRRRAYGRRRRRDQGCATAGIGALLVQFGLCGWWRCLARSAFHIAADHAEIGAAGGEGGDEVEQRAAGNQ